jgi:hypothetical protein
VDSKHYNIVTLDGGGFHGIITACILKDLISSMPELLDRVTLFGGTSTGSIISLGLASRLMTIHDLINFYETKGPEVFQPYRPRVSLNLCHFHPELCHPLYDNSGQIAALKPYFGSATFNDLKTKALVTTFVLSAEDDQIWHPLAIHNLLGNEFSNVNVLDAIMCSSSPPVFLPPYLLPGQPRRWCVDGAVFANNPTTFTLAHIQKLRILNLSDLASANEIRLLSIGTGIQRSIIPFREFGHPLDWGIFRWLNPSPPSGEPAVPLPMSFWDGQSNVDDYQAFLLLGEEKYRRANVSLPEPVGIDDFKAVHKMKRWTLEYLATPEWKSIKSWVESEFI